MERRSTLHWSALLLALLAVSLGILGFAGVLVFLLPLFGVAGFVLLLLAARHLDEARRPLARGGAILGLAVYAVWIVLRVASLPVGIEGSEGYTPPGFLSNLAQTWGSILALLTAFAIALGYWHLWGRRERGVGATGAAVVILLHLLALIGVPSGTSPAVGLFFQMLFTLGFLLLALAVVLPVFSPADDTDPLWKGTPA